MAFCSSDRWFNPRPTRLLVVRLLILYSITMASRKILASLRTRTFSRIRSGVSPRRRVTPRSKRSKSSQSLQRQARHSIHCPPRAGNRRGVDASRTKSYRTYTRRTRLLRDPPRLGMGGQEPEHEHGDIGRYQARAGCRQPQGTGRYPEVDARDSGQDRCNDGMRVRQLVAPQG
jgi:hypothetical protein